MNEYERLCGLYIDMLMTVWYSHEAWGWVVSVLFAEQTQSCLCGEDTSVQWLRLSQNDNILKLKNEFKLAPNPTRFGAGRQSARVVNQA